MATCLEYCGYLLYIRALPVFSPCVAVCLFLSGILQQQGKGAGQLLFSHTALLYVVWLLDWPGQDSGVAVVDVPRASLSPLYARGVVGRHDGV